ELSFGLMRSNNVPFSSTPIRSVAISPSTVSFQWRYFAGSVWKSIRLLPLFNLRSASAMNFLASWLSGPKSAVRDFGGPQRRKSEVLDFARPYRLRDARAAAD